MGLALDGFWKKWYNISCRRRGNDSCSWVHRRRLRLLNHFFQVQSRVAGLRLLQHEWIRELRSWIFIRCDSKRYVRFFCIFRLTNTFVCDKLCMSLTLWWPPFDFFVQLVAARLFYQKEFFSSRLIGIAFFELPGPAGGFHYTKIRSKLKSLLRIVWSTRDSNAGPSA